MDRGHVLATLRANEPALRAAGAASLYLFGSTARGTARSDSDVDLFLDYADDRFSLIEQLRLEAIIGSMLDARVDLTTRGGLHPSLRSRIEASALRVF